MAKKKSWTRAEKLMTIGLVIEFLKLIVEAF